MAGKAVDKAMWTEKARSLAFWFLAMLAAASIGVLLAAKPAQAVTFTVNSTGDEVDISPPNGLCDVDIRPLVSRCTLREALEEVNANNNDATVVDSINFNIPATDPNCNATTRVCTISPASALPEITEPVVIDGYTQRPCSTNPAPCSKPNNSAVGTNAVLLIQLNGANTPTSPGLSIKASNSLVKGLVINRFGGGIGITRTASVNPTGNRIEGNFIGTDPGGTRDRGNLFQGVGVSFGSNNTVGGTSRAARNLISGNGANGVVAQGPGTKVLGNLVGTDRTGTEDLGNDEAGVWAGWPNQTIGGDTATSANVIAFNGKDGVTVYNPGSTGNAIQRNSIFSNAGLGIDLNDDGRTANDVGDGDTGGPNNLQNFPILTSAETAGTTTIQGRLNSTPNTLGFVVRFFSNPSKDNEGRRYLGQTSVNTNASGNTGIFTFTPNQVVPVGQTITATTTDPGGNTSEFSAPREVTAS